MGLCDWRTQGLRSGVCDSVNRTCQPCVLIQRTCFQGAGATLAVPSYQLTLWSFGVVAAELLVINESQVVPELGS